MRFRLRKHSHRSTKYQLECPDCGPFGAMMRRRHDDGTIMSELDVHLTAEHPVTAKRIAELMAAAETDEQVAEAFQEIRRSVLVLHRDR